MIALRHRLLVVVLLAIADLALSPVIHLIPRTLWHPLHPALTWPALWDYLLHPAAPGRPPRWWVLALAPLLRRPVP